MYIYTMDKARSKPLVIIQSYEDRNSGKQLNQTISERLSNHNQKETPQEKSTTPVARQGSNVAALSPPPPPPLPVEETDDVDNIKSPVIPKQKLKAPPPPIPQKVTSSQPPPCPPPDYDMFSINSCSTLPKKSPINGFIKKEIKKSLSHNGEAVELESLQSYKLNQQNDIKPRPPNTYFKPQNSSTPQIQNGAVSSSTLTKQRPVSVIIGEYPSGTSRKQPKKLDFLNNSREDGYRSQNQSIVSQFASELAQTLNRSNLRKKTESMTNGD